MGAINFPDVQTVLDENGEPVEVVQGSTGKAKVQDEDVIHLLIAILNKLSTIENELSKLND